MLVRVGGWVGSMRVSIEEIIAIVLDHSHVNTSYIVQDMEHELYSESTSLFLDTQ